MPTCRALYYLAAQKVSNIYNTYSPWYSSIARPSRSNWGGTNLLSPLPWPRPSSPVTSVRRDEAFRAMARNSQQMFLHAEYIRVVC